MVRRRGYSLLEIFVAGTVLAAVLVISVQLVRATAAQRQATGRRQVAVQETANLMERLVARPWAELTPEAARSVQLSAEVRQALPGADLAVDVAPAPGDAEAKTITVQLRWKDGAGQWLPPVRLVALRYRERGD